MLTSEPIPSGAGLRFTLIKKKSDGTTIASGEFSKRLDYKVAGPSIADVKPTTDDTTNTTTVSVTGENLNDSSLKYTLTSDSAEKTRSYPDPGKTAVPISKLTPTSFELVFKSTDLDPGNWLIHLTDDQLKTDVRAPKPFLIPIKPDLTLATANATGKQITVTGTGFFDLPNEPKMKLTFKILLKSGAEANPKTTTIKDTSTVVLDLNFAAKPGEDKVELFVGTDPTPKGRIPINKK